MKKIMIIGLLTAALSVAADAKKPASFGVFYSSLSPYGEWIQMDAGYCWRPLHVAAAWRPYMYGQWVWSDYGWYWVSNEPFGWATFHYGRWTYDDYYGWIWIPDDNWGPAWVEWRYDDDYVGWAPLTPYASFDVSYGVRYTSRWAAPVHYWNFVPCRNFTAVRVAEYVQPIEQSRRIFGSTRAAAAIRVNDHRVVNGGVDVRFVEQRANTRINRVDLVSRDRADAERLVRGSGTDRVEAYRPRLDREDRNLPDRPRDFRVDERRHESVQGGNNNDGRVVNPRSGGRMLGPDAGRQPNAPGARNDRREAIQRDQQQRIQDQRRDQQQRIQDQQQRRDQDRREAIQRQQQREQNQQRQQARPQVERRQEARPQPQRQQARPQIERRQQNERPRIQQERKPPPEGRGRDGGGRGNHDGRRRP